MLKIGHRGASAHSPENTIEAFRKAIELGADGIELDAHCCKSGEVVVIHDDTVDRTTNGTGRVADLTLAELKSLRIQNNKRIPTLEEVFSALGDAVHFFVEVKHDNAALPVAKIMEHYAGMGWPREKLWLISFRHAAIAAALKSFPSLYIGASFERLNTRSVAEAKALGAEAILPHYQSLKPSHLQQAIAADLKVIPWTVNEKKDIARLAAMDVDGIISNYPERLNV